MAVDIKEFSTQLFLLHTEYSKLWRKVAAKNSLYSGQERIFFALVDYHDGCTLNEISKITGIGVSSLSVSISNMEKNGDIRKELDPNDKRICRIYTTPEGLKKFNKFTGTIDMLFSDFLEKFRSDGGNDAQLLEHLKSLTDYVSEKYPE